MLFLCKIFPASSTSTKKLTKKSMKFVHVFLLALMLMVNFIKSKPNTYLVETEETTNAETGNRAAKGSSSSSESSYSLGSLSSSGAGRGKGSCMDDNRKRIKHGDRLEERSCGICKCTKDGQVKCKDMIKDMDCFDSASDNYLTEAQAEFQYIEGDNKCETDDGNHWKIGESIKVECKSEFICLDGSLEIWEDIYEDCSFSAFDPSD